MPRSIRSRVFALATGVTVGLIPLTVIAPAAARADAPVHTVTLAASDFVTTLQGDWALPQLTDATRQLTITLPISDLDARGVSSVRVSGSWFSPSRGGVSFSSRLTVDPHSGPVVLPVSVRPSDATSYSVIIQSTGSHDQAVLEGDGTAIAGPGVANVPTDLSASTALAFRTYAEHIGTSAVTVARGDLLEIDVPAGVLTHGLDGSWSAPGASGAVLESPGDANWGPANSSISADGSRATIVIPGRPGESDDTVFDVSLTAQAAAPSSSFVSIILDIVYAPVPTPVPTRIGGADRYQAAVNIADSRYGLTGAPVVWIAKGTDYPDALSAAPAAVHQGGPLLLTDPNSLPAEVAAEIRKLHPSRIVVVGGTDSVTPATFDALSALLPGVTPTRIGGADRYEVSRNVITRAFIDAPGFSGVPRVYLATGRNFPDALSASAVAAHLGAPVLLVDGLATQVDRPTSELIAALRLTGPGSSYWLSQQAVLIAGGPASVTEAYLDSVAQLPTVATGVGRLTGADRYASSQAIAHEGTLSTTSVFLATGLTFPDALAGAGVAGAEGAPLYVVPGDCVPQGVLDDIRQYRAERVTLLGGEASLSPAVAALTPCVP